MEIKVSKPTEREIEDSGIKEWPIWECEPSTFDWFYSDRETCLILEGDVTVKSELGDVTIGPGDRVVFPKGLKCVWEVRKAVRKHYQFG
jgi:uncharacterized cupin superfamily protein